MAAEQTQPKDSLRITEIFYSLQGESDRVGLPTVFIRLTGCPLRCGYCDTPYAFKGGQWMAFDAILEKLAQYRTPYVTVTGGEPLAQKNCLPLLTMLCDKGYQVSLETSGALSVAPVDPRVMKVMDIKTPGSLEESKNDYSNIDYLLPHDQVKFVICDENDYNWVKRVCNEYDLFKRCHLLFSPSHGELDPGTLGDWILTDQLPVRLQVQLHKYLWGNEPGR